MISSHAVSKSTFRLSMVAAIVAAAYTAYEGWEANVHAYNDTLQMVLTYECGGGQSDDNLRTALNGARSDLRQRRVRDEEKPKDAVTKAANATDEVIEVVGHIPAAILATWGMTEGEVRLILPGEPISG